MLVWDGEGAIGRWRRAAQADRAPPGLPRHTGDKVVVCKPAVSEAKGLAERVRDYLKRPILRGRSFTGPADFNA